ncbi:MAG: NADH:ubiquinone reductase (Na(+)-transporting) subunit C [Bacteroidales bacterium]|nr:NADH:ubiquinone reductase (Na(+)-transporting) subunit C [Bacteroidales bacterium]
MKHYSNRYIFIYVTVLALIVATVLSIIVNRLKPLQDYNKETEKIQQILSAAGYEGIDRNEVKTLFSEISDELVVDKTGAVISRYNSGTFSEGDIRAFDIDDKTEYLKATNGEDYHLPIFAINNNVFVVPVHGKGLWGPIWGYVAVADDGKTIVGTAFSHDSETPGLGGEISSDIFQSGFKGKKIFDRDNNFVSVKVIKGGVANSNCDPQYAADAISGATSTSKGVDDMLRTCLELYVPFFRNYLK